MMRTFFSDVKGHRKWRCLSLLREGACLWRLPHLLIFGICIISIILLEFGCYFLSHVTDLRVSFYQRHQKCNDVLLCWESWEDAISDVGCYDGCRGANCYYRCFNLFVAAHGDKQWQFVSGDVCIACIVQVTCNAFLRFSFKLVNPSTHRPKYIIINLKIILAVMNFHPGCHRQPPQFLYISYRR